LTLNNLLAAVTVSKSQWTGIIHPNCPHFEWLPVTQMYAPNVLV
jgi:hypothetical protein